MNKHKFILMAQKKIEQEVEAYCKIWGIDSVPANDIQMQMVVSEYMDAEGNLLPEVKEAIKKQKETPVKEEPTPVAEEVEEEIEEEAPEETPLEKARRVRAENAEQRQQEEQEAEEEVRRELEQKPKGLKKLRGILRKKPENTPNESPSDEVVWD